MGYCQVYSWLLWQKYWPNVALASSQYCSRSRTMLSLRLVSGLSSSYPRFILPYFLLLICYYSCVFYFLLFHPCCSDARSILCEIHDGIPVHCSFPVECTEYPKRCMQQPILEPWGRVRPYPNLPVVCCLGCDIFTSHPPLRQTQLLTNRHSLPKSIEVVKATKKIIATDPK